MYDKKNFQYGLEIEWGDILRSTPIPEHLGSWEYCEKDIVNLLPPYQYVAADPLGLEPPVGGEINTMPSVGWQKQVEIFDTLRDEVFAGQTPTVSCLSATHVHICVPGLKEDVAALKRLIRYIGDNQEETILRVGMYDDSLLPEKRPAGAKAYFKHDGGRRFPEWRIQAIHDNTVDFESFYLWHSLSKDGKRKGRTLRYGINTYCLKYHGTVEFRLFRGTKDTDQLRDCFLLVEAFMEAALNDGPPVSDILSSKQWNFPPFFFDLEQWNGWVNTKYDDKRGKKVRHFYDIVN